MISFICVCDVCVLYKDIRQKPQAPGDHHPEDRSHETSRGNQRPYRHSRQLPTDTNKTAMLGHFQEWKQQLYFYIFLIFFFWSLTVSVTFQWLSQTKQSCFTELTAPSWGTQYYCTLIVDQFTYLHLLKTETLLNFM